MIQMFTSNRKLLALALAGGVPVILETLYFCIDKTIIY